MPLAQRKTELPAEELPPIRVTENIPEKIEIIPPQRGEKGDFEKEMAEKTEALERAETKPETPSKVIEMDERRSLEDLEVILKRKITNTAVEDLEKDPDYPKMLTRIAGKMVEKYGNDEANLAKVISDTAYRVSNGDIGTYAHLLSIWESDVNERLRKSGI